jgi:hypothetical protein
MLVNRGQRQIESGQVAPLRLSDEGENDGGPKNDPDPYKAERCN